MGFCNYNINSGVKFIWLKKVGVVHIGDLKKILNQNSDPDKLSSMVAEFAMM
jgi:hypothetical protein